MKIQLLPPEVLDALRNRDFSDTHIEKLTARNLFHQYCAWHGLADWGHDLYDLAHELARRETESRGAQRPPGGGKSKIERDGRTQRA